MKLALDTNAYGALQAGSSTRLADVARTAELLAIPVIVLGELRHGFMNGGRQLENEQRLERFLGMPAIVRLDLDEGTTRLFAEIATGLRRAGRSIQQNDIWIAALCRQHGFALATRDRGFQRVVGLSVLEF